MKYNELTKKRQRKPRRSGRGIAAGHGKTAGRGTKGQGARKSGGVRPGFEGGQMPLYMRLPKLRGFKSKRTSAEVVYTGQLDQIKKSTVDTQTLYEASLISGPYIVVKLLVKGELQGKKQVKLPRASKAAAGAVVKAGGQFEVTPRLLQPAKKNQTDK